MHNLGSRLLALQVASPKRICRQSVLLLNSGKSFHHLRMCSAFSPTMPSTYTREATANSNHFNRERCIDEMIRLWQHYPNEAAPLMNDSIDAIPNIIPMKQPRLCTTLLMLPLSHNALTPFRTTVQRSENIPYRIPDCCFGHRTGRFPVDQVDTHCWGLLLRCSLDRCSSRTNLGHKRSRRRCRRSCICSNPHRRNLHRYSVAHETARHISIAKISGTSVCTSRLSICMPDV